MKDLNFTTMFDLRSEPVIHHRADWSALRPLFTGESSMSNLTTFNFNTNTLRVVEINGDPWFVAKDVCEVLEMKGYASTYLANLDSSEKQTLKRNTNEISVSDRRELFSGSKAPVQSLISESGLYKLIMRSNMPQAKPFQDWVTKVVLPTIRKEGGYIDGEENITDEDELFFRAITIMQRKLERLTEEKQIAEGERDYAVKAIAEVNRSLREVCRKLPHVNLNLVSLRLKELGYFYRSANGAYRVYRKHEGLFTEHYDEAKGWSVICPTEDGIRLLFSLYNQGMLTLKKGFRPDVSASY